MQVTETLSEGLKRELKVTVPAADLEADIEGRLDELRRTVTMKGFRRGKVPLSIMRRHYQPRVMGEVLQQTIETRSREIIEERALRPAMQPEIEITAFDEGKDLEFTMGMEVLPSIELGDFAELEVTRLKAEVSDESVEDALGRLAEADKVFEPVEPPRPAAAGDQLLVDIAVEVDGKPAPERSGTDLPLELDTEALMPEMTEQLVGAEAGDEREVTLTPPEPESEGGDATEAGATDPATVFRITVKEVRERLPVSVDDAFAERRGADNLDALRGVIREQIQEQYEHASQARLKRSLLDLLDEHYRFDVPPGMVEREFEAVWEQIENDAKGSEVEIAEMLDQPEEEAREEFRQIAERRVRLGLLIAEIGGSNEITVEQEDLLRAAMMNARGHPEPQRLLEYYRSQPQALERFRPTVFEDKVIAFLSELATVSDEIVDVETLLRDPDEDETPSEPESAEAGEQENAAPDADESAAPDKSD
ncbi:MAG: trigger factor [Rhodospirillales bacterium]|nr:trigger factor [Rhodospirillales bacterium]MDE0380226.1 trigger factor [Rhodospirillales bacterium]